MDQRKRILVVDDDPKLVDFIRTALERADFSVVTAANGLQGEKVFRSNPVDLIMLDVMMPQRDGFDMLKDVRAISSVPIIMLTALSDTDNVVRGLELGADDYITKPFELKQVLAEIAAWKAPYPAIACGTEVTPGEVEVVRGKNEFEFTLPARTRGRSAEAGDRGPPREN